MPRSRVSKSLTTTRGPVHGNFAEGAAITQGIILILSGASNWSQMSAAKKEALHMMIHKIHRIVTGNADHKDHWDDIGGYAQLGADDCSDTAMALERTKPRKTRKIRGKAKAKAKKSVIAKVVTRRPRAPAELVRKRATKAAKKTVVRRPRTAPTLVPEAA